MKTLTTEQLLLIADEFTPVAKTRVRSFGALAACAAVPGARVHGVAVYDTVESASAALADTIRTVRPLVHRNEEFAGIASRVYARFCMDADSR